jgi:N-acetylglutamate synthase-like GNAT family acetyltransferase
MSLGDGMIRPIETKDVFACQNIVWQNWNVDILNRFIDEVGMAFNKTLKWPPEYFVYESINIDCIPEIIGFAGIMPSYLKEGVWDLVWVNVAKDCQHIGVGTELVDYIIDKVKERGGIAIHLMTEKFVFFGKFGFDGYCDGKYGGNWAFMSLVF